MQDTFWQINNWSSIAGFYCLENSTTYLNTPCPVGHYCPEGTESADQFPCEMGSYNNYTGKSSDLDCVPCDPGLYCPTSGLEVPLPRKNSFCEPEKKEQNIFCENPSRMLGESVKGYPHRRRIGIRPKIELMNCYAFQWQFVCFIRDECQFVSGVDRP